MGSDSLGSQWSAVGFIHMIYYVGSALGSCVCSHSHIVFIICATFKKRLPLTLSLLSRLDIPTPPPPQPPTSTTNTTTSSPPHHQLPVESTRTYESTNNEFQETNINQLCGCKYRRSQTRRPRPSERRRNEFRPYCSIWNRVRKISIYHESNNGVMFLYKC